MLISIQWARRVTGQRARQHQLALDRCQAVGCFRVGPVLAGLRNRLSEPGIHALHQLAKPAVQQTVAMSAARELLVKPPTLHALHPLAADSVPDKESRPIPSMQEIATGAHTAVKIWVIESPSDRGNVRPWGIGRNAQPRRSCHNGRSLPRPVRTITVLRNGCTPQSIKWQSVAKRS